MALLLQNRVVITLAKCDKVMGWLTEGSWWLYDL